MPISYVNITIEEDGGILIHGTFRDLKYWTKDDIVNHLDFQLQELAPGSYKWVGTIREKVSCYDVPGESIEYNPRLVWEGEFEKTF